MSWDDYVNKNLRGAGFCYAAIVGTDGTPYASTPQYTVLPEEARFMATLLSSDSLDAVTQEGFKVAGQKYAFVRGELEDDAGTVDVPYIQGRSKEKSAQAICIMRTGKCLVIGVFDPAYSNSISLGTANTEMGKLCDYLVENNY
eukprot:Plantae.Rhodophyta-Purpureofilum_apyrenoidigerum.ctg22560.p1 GENE.Plantae.Rhodophyta-Purpureofilum_apyrenoidigerum.ctg22560~~Plantae.Rhodophyta-Purpureofilum_apyrenoidigerum.ctg22560.p1  ORF type:complete len:144 (-),score=24.73 Plantae.Rhodophyta-Purpureofilum_apyrenoidigerum.ctg22560:271-702(-)